MKKQFTFLSITCLLSSYQAFAQDPGFSQFFATPIFTNPAFAGSAVNGRVCMAYRNQWTSVPGTYRTFAGSYDEHIEGIGGGIGIMATQDIAGQGLLTTTTFSAMYSYHLQVNNYLHVKAGIEGQYFQRSIDFSKLLFGDQIVPKQGFVNPTNETVVNSTIAIPNFASGVVAYTDKFHVGAAVHNMAEPGQSFYGSGGSANSIPRRFTIHGGMLLPLVRSKYNETTISPNIIVMRQREFTQLMMGFFINKGPLITGMWFRQTAANTDAFTLLGGFRTGKFKFGYSYDVTVSSGRSALKGSHEITASIEWNKTKTKRFPKLICPSFW